MSDLGELSDWLRRDIIIVSGGWLADIVPFISDALGIWDIFIMCGVFVISWVVLRVTDPLTAMILGFTFDVTIPLQHYMNPNLKDQHKGHLEGYWPILTFGTGLEALCFVMIHPDLFTLVVCLKTTLMTAIWLGRRGDGSFFTEPLGARGVRTHSASSGKSTSSSGREKEEKPKKDKKSAEEGKKDRKAKPKAKDPNLETTQNPLKPTGQHPGNIDPSEFKGDLMDIYAPPGRGPPITNDDVEDDIADRKRRGLKEVKVRGSDSESDGPTDSRKFLRGRGKPQDWRKMQRRGSMTGVDGGIGGVDRGGDLGQGDLSDDGTPGLWTRYRAKRAAKKMAKQLEGYEPAPPPEENVATVPFNEADACFQFPVETVDENGQRVKMDREDVAELDTTAVWEQALSHDSLDLLNFYMKRNNVPQHVAGQVIMDIVCEEDPLIVREMAKALRRGYHLQDLKEFLKPYQYIEQRKEGWGAVRGFFGRAQIGGHGGKVKGGEMDDFIWRLRAAGVPPEARHAMLRDLMSRASEGEYYGLKKYLLDIVEGKTPSNIKPREGVSQRESDVARLSHGYLVKRIFEGQYHLSADDMEKLYKRLPRVAAQTRASMMRMARWGCVQPGDEGSVEGIVAELASRLGVTVGTFT